MIKAVPQRTPTMSMFSSITGGIFTQNHGNVVHLYGAPEVRFRLCENNIRLLKQETGSLGALQLGATATAAFHNSEQFFDPPKCHPNTRVAVLNKIKSQRSHTPSHNYARTPNSSQHFSSLGAIPRGLVFDRWSSQSPTKFIHTFPI